MPQPSGKRSPLSVHRAFVVQFRAETDVKQGRFEGRVEHVVSGQASHFRGLDELLAFLAHVVADLGRTSRAEEGGPGG